MGARRASRGRGRIGSFRSGTNRDVARRQVHNTRRDEKGRDPPGPAVEKVEVLALDHVEPADPAADVDAHSFRNLGSNFQLRSLESELRACHREEHEPAHLLQLPAVDEIERVEVLHFSRDAAGEIRRIKQGDRLDAVLSVTERAPRFFGAHSDRAHQADSGYNHSSRQSSCSCLL